MKKPLLVLAGLLILPTLCSCATAPEPEASLSITFTAPLATAAATHSSAPSAATSAGPAATASATPVGMSDKPQNDAKMYSSYAHMVSYDVARGWADFDYFDLLKGDDAVAYLVDHDGYSQTEAQEIVDQFADSEFIEKNANPQLRTVDLRSLPLKLLYHPDGTMAENSEPIDATLDDLYALYTLNPDLVLDYFFYWIEVQNGEVVSVEQVYWP